MDRSIIHLNIADFAVAVETNMQAITQGISINYCPPGSPPGCGV